MKIIYQNAEGGVGLILPALSCGLSLQQIARKDVPYGAPFRIVPDESVPEDLELMGAWEADFTEPDGNGIGPQRWLIQGHNAAIAGIGAEIEEAAAARALLAESLQAATDAEIAAAEDLQTRIKAVSAEPEEGEEASDRSCMIEAAAAHHQNCLATKLLAQQCLAALDALIERAGEARQHEQARRDIQSDELFQLEGVRL